VNLAIYLQIDRAHILKVLPRPARRQVLYSNYGFTGAVVFTCGRLDMPRRSGDGSL
jgi:hypothetical protein